MNSINTQLTSLRRIRSIESGDSFEDNLISDGFPWRSVLQNKVWLEVYTVTSVYSFTFQLSNWPSVTNEIPWLLKTRLCRRAYSISRYPATEFDGILNYPLYFGHLGAYQSGERLYLLDIQTACLSLSWQSNDPLCWWLDESTWRCRRSPRWQLELDYKSSS